MRTWSCKSGARRRTDSLILKADLCAQSSPAELNLSKIAEEALSNELRPRIAKPTGAEIRRDLAAHNAFVEEHGSFAKVVREHYAAEDDL